MNSSAIPYLTVATGVVAVVVATLPVRWEMYRHEKLAIECSLERAFAARGMSLDVSWCADLAAHDRLWRPWTRWEEGRQLALGLGEVA